MNSIDLWKNLEGIVRRNYYILAVLLLLLATAAASWLLLRTKPQPPPLTIESLPVAVRTTTVQRGELQTVVREKGRLLPTREAKLLFQTEGQIVHRHVVPGQQVGAGELLLDIEDSSQRSSVQRAQAKLAAAGLATDRDQKLLQLARDRVALLDEQVQRQQALQQDAFASLDRLQQVQRELLAAKVELQRLQHEVVVAEQTKKQLRADLTMAERLLAHCHIRSPFAAKVNQLTVQQGDHAVPGQLAIHLVSSDELDVLVAVRGENVQALQLGGKGEVLAPGQSLPRAAIVRELQLVPDERTFTHMVRLELLDSTGLRAGQVVELVLPGRSWQEVLLVPYDALWQEEGQYYLYTVDANDSLQHSTVQLIASTTSMAAVSGVTKGQEIVLDAAQTILPGQLLQRVDIGQ